MIECTHTSYAVYICLLLLLLTVLCALWHPRMQCTLVAGSDPVPTRNERSESTGLKGLELKSPWFSLSRQSNLWVFCCLFLKGQFSGLFLFFRICFVLISPSAADRIFNSNGCENASTLAATNKLRYQGCPSRLLWTRDLRNVARESPLILIYNKRPLWLEGSKVTVTSLNTFQMRVMRNSFQTISERLKWSSYDILYPRGQRLNTLWCHDYSTPQLRNNNTTGGWRRTTHNVVSLEFYVS